MVHRPEPGHRLGHRQPHLVTDRSVTGVQRGQCGTGVEPVDGFHEVEDGIAEHRGVLAHRDQMRMWYVGVGQCAQYPSLAQDHLVVIGRRWRGPRRKT